jgi:hypothetical protein
MTWILGLRPLEVGSAMPWIIFLHWEFVSCNFLYALPAFLSEEIANGAVLNVFGI